MAGYCTVDDLGSGLRTQSLAELTADSGDVVDVLNAEAVIEMASREIDRYLWRWTVPVTDPATLTVLKPLCVAISRFKLFARADLSPAERDKDPVHVEYLTAIDFLRLLSKGQASLPPSATPASTPEISETVVGAYGSEGMVFTGEQF